jgi:hypothetical protein
MRFSKASPLIGVPTVLWKTGASSGGAPEVTRWRESSWARTVEIGTSRMPHPTPEDADVRPLSSQEDEAPPEPRSGRAGGAGGDQPARGRATDPHRVNEPPRDRRGGRDMTESRRTSIEEARRVGDAIGVDWTRFDLEQFRTGMDVELEHGSHDPQTDVTHDDPILTGKIALAHMKEFPDYYERLERMEREAKLAWADKSR